MGTRVAMHRAACGAAFDPGPPGQSSLQPPDYFVRGLYLFRLSHPS